MHLSIVTTNPILAEVLAEELNEVRGVEADVIDIVAVERNEFVPADDDVLVVTEAAIERWCRWRSRRDSPLPNLELIGALGSRWLSHDSPESRGFVGCIDFKWPACDLIREIKSIRQGSSFTCEASQSSLMANAPESLCHDDIDRRIVAFITMGLSDREIGAKVYLSSQTVRNRVSRMLERSHVQNRTQLAMACVSNPRLLVVQRHDEVSTPLSESVVR